MPTILLVEDNLLNKELIAIFVKGMYELDHAIDGYAAITMANQKVYEAILMDINLKSDMDGIQAASEIKQLPGYQEVPIAAVTGYTSATDVKRIMNSDCTYYLGKPFDKGSLLNLIREMLQKRALNWA